MEDVSIYLDVWGEIIAPDEYLLETFPNYVNLELGRLPENNSEIALIQSLQLYYEIELGDIVALLEFENPQNLTVVGFYEHEGQAASPYFWNFESIAIVVPGVINESYGESVFQHSIQQHRSNTSIELMNQ